MLAQAPTISVAKAGSPPTVLCNFIIGSPRRMGESRSTDTGMRFHLIVSDSLRPKPQTETRHAMRVWAFSESEDAIVKATGPLNP